MWENADGGGKSLNRERKKVTFQYVPSLRTDEAITDFTEKALSKNSESKIFKDAPMHGGVHLSSEQSD